MFLVPPPPVRVPAHLHHLPDPRFHLLVAGQPRVHLPGDARDSVLGKSTGGGGVLLWRVGVVASDPDAGSGDAREAPHEGDLGVCEPGAGAEETDAASVPEGSVVLT